MEMFLRYITIATICLSLLYITYLAVFKNESDFRQLRFYLLASIILSLLIPLNKYELNIPTFTQTISETSNKVFENSPENLTSKTKNSGPTLEAGVNSKFTQTHINWLSILTIIYSVVTLFFIARLLVQVISLIILYIKSDKEKTDNCVIIYTDQFKNPFSFFGWIFIPKELAEQKDIEKIIIHEKIHVKQYHSLDLLLIELISAVMWFNPLVKRMRNSLQLVHEYLADEGVLSTGIDKLKYQALLLNQVTEERLICLSSSFNHSLIKKRMIMMTKSKFNQKTKLKILALVPVVAILFTGVSCINGQNSSNVVAAIAPVKMNVLYLGVDNPMQIAVSGYESSKIDVSIDNGTITGDEGEYIVRPKQQGAATLTVQSDGKTIKTSVFRVKIIPDPVAKVARKKGGEIEKDKLLEQTEVIADMENFDFDLSFEVVGFTVSTTIKGYVKEYSSTSNKITKEQKELFKQFNSGQRFYIQDIKCKGPDGIIRKLGTIAFKLI